MKKIIECICVAITIFGLIFLMAQYGVPPHNLTNFIVVVMVLFSTIILTMLNDKSKIDDGR